MKLFFSLIFISTIFASDSLPVTFTDHIFPLSTKPFKYTAVTGKFPINPDHELFTTNETPLPEIFFIAFLKDGEENRPITFIFPGGPGGSCGPESILMFGPKRLVTSQEGKSILPPYQLIDNPQSLLPYTDLVYIDPVGTGFSTLGESETAIDNFFSVDGDIVCLGDFIRNFIDIFGRYNCPKYLSGISYGTTRCCGIADYLLSHDILFNGIMLFGCALDFSTLIGQHNRSLPDSLLIPTFAATAWYHGRFCPEKTLEDVVEYAKRFTYEQYIPSLLQPLKTNPLQKENLYQEMADLIGLPIDTVRRYQGRFDETLYTTEFYGPDRKVIGGLDSRYIGDLTTNIRIGNNDDPSYRDMHGIYCAFHQYLADELDTQQPFEPYIKFSTISNFLWNYHTYDSIEWPDLVQRIRRTLVHNPKMQIFVGSGYFDCRTPFTATEYCFEHLELPSSYFSNIQFGYYPAGHGFMFDYECLKKLYQDVLYLYTPYENTEELF